MTKDEALKLALNVLINRVDSDHDAIIAIREVLAQPEQEPVAWITKNGKGWLRWHRPEDNEKNKDSIPLYTTPLQRKPLSGYINRAGINANDSPITVVEKLERAIEASNQETQRIWQGLTDEEVLDMARTFGAQPWPPGSCVAFGQMVEAKLKEKNA